MTPTPPYGFTSWLDWAFEAAEWRDAWTSHTRAAIKAELAALRARLAEAEKVALGLTVKLRVSEERCREAEQVNEVRHQQLAAFQHDNARLRAEAEALRREREEVYANARKQAAKLCAAHHAKFGDDESFDLQHAIESMRPEDK